MHDKVGCVGDTKVDRRKTVTVSSTSTGSGLAASTALRTALTITGAQRASDIQNRLLIRHGKSYRVMFHVYLILTSNGVDFLGDHAGVKSEIHHVLDRVRFTVTTRTASAQFEHTDSIMSYQSRL
jgi:hypothetical protein